MCSPNDNRRKEMRPVLPEQDLDLDDPMRFIPTELRSFQELPNINRCSRCGTKATEDELVSNNGHHRRCPDLFAHSKHPQRDKPTERSFIKPVIEANSLDGIMEEVRIWREREERQRR